MINEIVKNKKLLESLMMQATAQSKSKKPSEIFENFYKISQSNYKSKLESLQAFLIDEITSFPLTKEIDKESLNGLTNFVKKEIDRKYPEIYGPIFYDIIPENTRDENKIDLIQNNLFKDDDSKKRWISGLIQYYRINKTDNKDFDFSLETYLKGLYNRFKLPKDKSVDIETPGLILSDQSALKAFDDIDERVDSEPGNIETQENFNSIEELLNKKIKEAEQNNEFYALFIFESILLDNFKIIQKIEKKLDEEKNNGTLLEKFNKGEFQTLYSDVKNVEEIYLREKNNIYNLKESFVNEVLAMFAKTETKNLPAFSPIFQEVGQQKAFEKSIQEVEKITQNRLTQLNLSDLVDSYVDNPYSIYPSGLEKVDLFSKQYFGNDSYTRAFIKCFLTGLCYDMVYYQQNRSQPVPRSYTNPQGGSQVISNKRFSSYLMSKLFKDLLAQKPEIAKNLKEYELAEEFLKMNTDNFFGLTRFDESKQEYVPIPAQKIGAFIDGPLYDYGGQIALIGASNEAEIKVVADILFEKNRRQISYDEAVSMAKENLFGKPNEIYAELMKWVNEKPEVRLEQPAGFFRSKTNIERLKSSYGKNFVQILKDNGCNDQEIENAKEEIISRILKKLSPDGAFIFPVVQYGRTTDKANIGNYIWNGETMAFEIVPSQKDPTIDVGTEMRTYKPSEIGEQSDRYDRLKVYFDSLREKLQLVGVLIQKPEEKIQDFYDDFENYDDNIISYFTYVKEMLEPKFNELQQLPRKNRNSFDEQSYKVIQNLLNFEINAKQKQFLSEEFKNPFERFQKELTMFKPSEELSPEKATEFFRNYIANFVENLISLTPERFQERGLNKDPNLPKLSTSMTPQQSQQLVAFTEKFITQIKKLAEENPSMFRKYLEYAGNPGEQLEKLKSKKRSKKSTEEAPEEITEASTQNIQKKVTSKVLDEMIKKYASKR